MRIGVCWLLFLACFFQVTVVNAIDANPSTYKDRLGFYNLSGAISSFREDSIHTYALDDILGIVPAEEQSDIPWVQTTEAVPHIGYDSGAVWFRVKLNNTTQNINWRFIVDVINVRVLDLYIVRFNAVDDVYHLGDRFEFASRPIPHRAFAIPLDLFPHESLEIFARIESVHNIYFPVRLVSETQFYQEEQSFSLIYGLLLGAFLLMLFYNFYWYLATTDSSYLYFSGMLFAMIIYQLGRSGLGYQYIWPYQIAWQQHAYPVGAALGLVFALRFVQSYLDTAQNLPRVNRCLSIAWLVAILVLISLCVFDLKYIKYIDIVWIFVAAVMIVIAIGVGLRTNKRHVRQFTFAWFVCILSLIVIQINKFGITERSAFLEYAPHILWSVGVGLLCLALAERIKASQDAQAALLEDNTAYEQRLRVAKERALEAERASKVRMERAVEARTTELRRAEAELETVNQQLETLDSIDSLTGVKSSLYFSERVADEWVRALRDGAWLSLILVAIDEPNRIEERYGSEALNEMLRCLASEIVTTASRPADFVGRVGDSTFGIMMPNTDGAGARLIAEEIYSWVSRESFDLGVCSVSITVSLSVLTRHPTPTENSDVMLHECLINLENIREQGGDQVHLEEHSPFTKNS